jgi:hypothetical protein
MKVELSKGAVMVTEGCYSIAFIVLDEKWWTWDHWLCHGKFGWNLIPSEEE